MSFFQSRKADKFNIVLGKNLYFILKSVSSKIAKNKNGRVINTLPFSNFLFEIKIPNFKSYSTPWGNNSRRS